jgi:hypothetical protein
MKINLKEFIQFFVLFSVLFVVAIVFRDTSDNLRRFLLILGSCVFYFLWGLWHHISSGRIDKLVVIEYGLVSFIIVFLAAMGLGVVRFF